MLAKVVEPSEWNKLGKTSDSGDHWERSSMHAVLGNDVHCERESDVLKNYISLHEALSVVQAKRSAQMRVRGFTML